MINNKEVYEKKYTDGYGIKYPDGHIIRIYEHFLKDLLVSKEKVNVLDFGCGNGTHIKYFAEKGFHALGIDISEVAIKYANCNKHENTKFVCMNLMKEEINSLDKFDLIIANQSIYYLSTSEIVLLMEKFEKVLSENGIVVFTMMTTNNYYFNHSVPSNDGLYEVKLRGRLNEDTLINFVKDESELIELFDRFFPLFVGKYDFTVKEGSSEHFYFIGQKK